MKRSVILPLLIVLFVCLNQEANSQQIIGVSEAHYDTDTRTAGGYSGTYIDYRIYDYYDPWVYGIFFFQDSPETPIDEGGGYGVNSGYPGTPYIGYTTWFNTANYVPERTYCTFSTHKVIAYYYYYYYGNFYWFDPYQISSFSESGGGGLYDWYGYPYAYYYVIPQIYSLGWTEACITTPKDPDPCDPGANSLAAGESCATPTPTPIVTPTPTPTPTPSPTATIQPIDVVEKFGTKEIKVTVANNPSGSTKFTIRPPTTGTGSATFDSGSNETVVNGNVTDMVLKIKGVTESSQVDNLRIEARLNGSTSVSAFDDFTVAVITSLEFQRYDSTYTDLDDNPGTDGVHTPDEGKRIYPEKKDIADANGGVDRSLVKVKANVLPAAAGLKVYFGSFDLDDPSTDYGPVDGNGPDGKDNNGFVNLSHSGDFVPTGGSPCDGQTTGTQPEYISKIQCTTADDGTVTAVFKTTMEPGDNFAVAATVDDHFRDSLLVNSADGSQIISSALPAQPAANLIDGGAQAETGVATSGAVAPMRPAPPCDPDIPCDPGGNLLPNSDPQGPYSGEVGQNIQFYGSSSSDDDGYITQYFWTFGDGATSTTADPQKSYSAAGTYNVSLRVRDNSGGYSTAYTSATVTDPATPTPTPTPVPSPTPTPTPALPACPTPTPSPTPPPPASPSAQALHISGEANPNNIPGIRTSMLTVWRQVHIEVDSMGTVPSSLNDPNVNKIRGTLTAPYSATCNSGPCIVYSFTATANVDEHRFQNGRIKFLTSGFSFRVADNSLNQQLNSQVVVLDGNPTNSNNVVVGEQFDLFDDDDFNDNNGTNLDGDANEALVPPDTSSASLINSTDVPCTNSVTSNCNVLAPAYIKPIYDLPNPNPITPFILNLPMSVDVTRVGANPADVQAAFRFDNVAYSDRDDFWVIYISSAYQIDKRWDGDPAGLTVLGITDSLLGSGQGCLLFLEASRPTEDPHWNIGPDNSYYTMAHEIGHKFGGRHTPDYGLMAPTGTSCSPAPVYRTEGTFSDITLNRMRGGLVNGSRLTHP